MKDMAFLIVHFWNFFRGTCPRTPLYNSAIRGWQSGCFSNHLVLKVQLQKNSIPRENEWSYRVWMNQKFEHQRNYTKWDFPLIKSFRESWIWKKILVGIMNHWSKKDRNHEYQDSNDSASTPDCSGQGAYFFFEKQPNVWKCLNKTWIFI